MKFRILERRYDLGYCAAGPAYLAIYIPQQLSHYGIWLDLPSGPVPTFGEAEKAIDDFINPPKPNYEETIHEYP